MTRMGKLGALAAVLARPAAATRVATRAAKPVAARLAKPVLAGRVATAFSRADPAVGPLVTRLVIGGLFIGHGTQKLFGWFGGPGPRGTEQMMSKIELHPPRRNAIAAGLTESLSGLLLAAGLATPLAAAGLIGVMTTAIRKVHLPNGLWVTNGGYEYNLMIIAGLLDLTDGGPGPLSADRALGIDAAGPGWALAALAAGITASAVTIEAGQRAARRRPAQATVQPGAEAASAPAPPAASRAAS